MATYDSIVIGLGGMGSAALCHLAERKQNVLGIDQFDIAHDRGSSHGGTRILRKAYFEHPDYVPLLTRTYEEWARLEAETNRQLIFRTGLMLVGRPELNLIPGVKQAAAEHGLDIDVVSLQEARERFPAFRPGDDMEVLYERDAGYLAVEACVEAHAERARDLGATVQVGSAVQSWTSDGRSVEVQTNGERFSAANLIICAGPWSHRVLAGLSVKLEVRRKVIAWYETDLPELTAKNGCPVFCFDTREGFFYGFPVIDDAGMKIGEHSGGVLVDDPDRIDRALHESDRLPLARFIQRYLPGVSTTPRDHAVCMYTMTPDEHFVIDTHPEYANVVFAAGFSGHGFKFAPVVGSILADLAIKGRTDHPIDFLRLSRFEA